MKVPIFTVHEQEKANSYVCVTLIAKEWYMAFPGAVAHILKACIAACAVVVVVMVAVVIAVIVMIVRNIVICTV